MLTISSRSGVALAAPIPRPGVRRELANARVAVVHDFLHMLAGSERALAAILELFPRADLFAQFDGLPPDQRAFLRGRSVRTTFLQSIPGIRRHYRHFLPLMPLAIENLNLSGYDLVISNSCVAAKGVLTRPHQLHICYCHTPARAAWDQETHLATAGINGPRAWITRHLLHQFRAWDVRSSNGVDVFLANSRFICQRIAKAYRRDATAIYPPVDVAAFPLREQKENFYVTVSRLVPYKRVDLIIEAFGQRRDRQLVVIGGGPEIAKLRRRATGNVTLLGHVPQEVLVDHVQRARGFVFAAEEDFGIAPVEAQASGTPVIAYGRGGVLETVIPGKTGVLFGEQRVDALLEALERFEDGTWDSRSIHAHARQFDVRHFKRHFRHEVEVRWNIFQQRAFPVSL